jgi:ribonuclease HII
MQCAIDNISCNYDEIIIDGNFNFLKELPNTRVIVKADATFPAVSAASIMAKVARDQYMIEAAIKYPEYGFERHVGYGTTTHMRALKKHGPCKLHRRSYKPIKDLVSAIR